MRAHVTSGARIDVHAHAIPAPYQAALDAAGIREDAGATIPAWDIDLALSFMSKYGIGAQVVSISEPGVGFLPNLADRVALAGQVNDYLSTELLNSPEPSIRSRFGAFALLPLRDLTSEELAATTAEAGRALTHLQLDGIGLFSNYEGIYLGDGRLDPLYRLLNEQNAVVFLHSAKPRALPPSSLPVFLCEFPFDTTRAVVSLGRAKVFARFPNIRWVLAHAGGTLPYLARRLARIHGVAHPDGAPDPGIPFDRLYYDTALSPAPASIHSVRAVAPLSQLLFGTDWPFAGRVFVVPGDPAPQLRESLTSEERTRVLTTNALDLLPTFATRITS